MDFSLIGANIVKLITTYWKVFLIDGVTKTLQFTCIAVVLGAILGTFVAMLKMSKLGFVRFLASVYIEVIRGTPILLQLYVFYFVLPEILPFLELSQFMWVAIAMCVNSGAYVSEVIRSGIQAVDAGQMEAGRSLGLSKLQTMRKIVFPQAIRYILPAIGNEMIALLKETSVAGYVAVRDLTKAGDQIRNNTYDAVNPLLTVALTYLALVVIMTAVLTKVEKRLAKK